MTDWRRRHHGQAAVEAALVLPLILLLVLGVVAVGVVGRTDAALLAVAEEAARAAATSTSASEAAAHGVARGQQVADGYRLLGPDISVDARDFGPGGHVRADATVTVSLVGITILWPDANHAAPSACRAGRPIPQSPMTIRFAGRSQRAQAIAWFVVMLPLFLSVIGLAVDGEAVLRAHRRAQGAADGAARTGATHVQVGHSRAEPGAPDVLDAAAAHNAAVSYIAQVYPDLQVKTAADEQHVVVVVTEQVAPTFLQLMHVSSVQVQARAEASPRGGIDRPIS